MDQAHHLGHHHRLQQRQYTRQHQHPVRPVPRRLTLVGSGRWCPELRRHRRPYLRFRQGNHPHRGPRQLR